MAAPCILFPIPCLVNVAQQFVLKGCRICPGDFPLTHQALDRLFPKILEQLKPNVKILCYRFCIQGMTPDKVNSDKTLFLYTMNKGTRVNQFR